MWIFEGFLTPEEVTQPGTTERFIDFFEGTCNQRISHFISTVKADLFANIDAPDTLINDGPNTPVLVINEIGYNGKDRPIVSSCEFHPGDWMTFRMMRRRGIS
jgi:DNA-binding GntR family transcriptional regulator